jgi:serine/threonine protein kinase
MDLSEPKLISPMLDDFMMGDPLSEHHGVRCCPAMRKDSDSRYIVKIISVPASQVQLEALLLTGAYSTQDAALAYFRDMANDVTEEVEVLKKLSKFEGFLPYENYQIVPMEDGAVGFDVYLLSPYKRTLERFLKSKPVTHLNAVNMGLDLCASMAMCRRAGYLYVDLKPSNIFVNDKNEFCIGDLGFVRLDALKYASLPERYRSAYTAPEIQDAMSSLNSTVDIYAIGMILYGIYNDGKLPKENELSELAPPIYADYEMSQIILKACDPNPEQRWQDPLQLGQELVAYMQRNSVNDTPIVPIPEPVVLPDPMPAPVVDEAPAQEEIPATDTAPAETPETGSAEEDVEEALTAALLSPEQEEVDSFIDELEDLIDMDDTEDQETNPFIEEEDAKAKVLPAPVPVESAENDPVEEDEYDDLEDFDPFGPAEDNGLNERDIADLSFMDAMVSDETVPQEDELEEIAYSDISDDASDILSMADELIAHKAPEPVVAPEPIEVPMPDPITFIDDDEALSAELAAALEEKEKAQQDVKGLVDFINNGYNDVDDESFDPNEYDETAAQQQSDEYDPVIVRREKEKKPVNKKLIKRVVITAFMILLAAAMFFGAYYFYHNYYLQTIDDMTLTGMGNKLIVELDTDVDNNLLRVECTDTYGTVKPGIVIDGKAVFTDLNPNTTYTVKVSINGFYQLTGDTTGTYTTPAQTTIVSFTALAGSEDGSFILNFTVDGQDSNDWLVTISTDGEEPREQSFTGHMVTVNGLTPGKNYTFRLSSPKLRYIVGKDAITKTATKLVIADDLTITACDSNGLTAHWNVPEDTEVSGWTVRCYNDQGFDETLTTLDTTISFIGIDPTAAYTLEVTADGMTVNARAYVSANSATISNFRVEDTDEAQLKLTWDNEGGIPADGWLLLYNLKDSEQQDVVRTSVNSALVNNLIPGETYEFSLQASDGTTVFGGTFTYKIPAPKNFEGHGVNASNMTFTMCITPEKENWKHTDVKKDQKTSEFTAGQKASFIVKLNRKYIPDKDVTDIQYVIRDKDGKLVSNTVKSETWISMWLNYYCELDVPSIPDVAGEYTIEIYFNSMFAHKQTFTVV